MSEQQTKIYEVLKNGSAFTRRQIADSIYGFGSDQARIYYTLESMVEAGIVKKFGERPAYYSLSGNVNVSKQEVYKAKTKKELHVVELTSENLQQAYESVLSDNTYGTELKLVEDIFTDSRYRCNTDVNIVALKIALIDVTNSTHLHQHKKQINLAELAEIIVYKIKDFDKRVATRDDSLVEELACGNGETGLFSFASKYCYYHNSLIYGRDDYAKYDTIVHDCLPSYLNQTGIKFNGKIVTPNTLETLRKKLDYKSFNELVDSVLTGINLDGKKGKFDYLMWYYNRS